MKFTSKLALAIAVGRHISGVYCGGGMNLTAVEEDGRHGYLYHDGGAAGLRSSLDGRIGGTSGGGTRDRRINNMSKEVRHTSFFIATSSSCSL